MEVLDGFRKFCGSWETTTEKHIAHTILNIGTEDKNHFDNFPPSPPSPPIHAHVHEPRTTTDTQVDTQTHTCTHEEEQPDLQSQIPDSAIPATALPRWRVQ